MTRKLTTRRHSLWPLGRTATAILAGGLVFLAIASVISWSWRSFNATAQPGSQAKLWPPFTMTYTVQQFDANTGAIRRDQTFRLVVTSEYNWRDDLIRDGIEPSEVGSFAEFKNGIYSTHSARLNTFKQNRTEDGIVAVSQVLDPTLFPTVKNEGKRGWEIVPGASKGRVAIVKTEPDEHLRVEFDERTVDDATYKGAIPVSAERRVNGRLVETFTVASLEIAR